MLWYARHVSNTGFKCAESSRDLELQRGRRGRCSAVSAMWRWFDCWFRRELDITQSEINIPAACLKLVLDCLELEAAFAAISARAQFNSPNCRSAHCNGQTPYKNYESTERTQLISHCIPQSQQPCIASVEQVNPVDHCNLFSFSIVHLQAV